jgi:hypothetical protein
MKKRWILNLVMLVLVAGLVAFLYLRPKTNNLAPKNHEVSQLKLADITAVKVEFPAQASVTFDKVNGFWRMNSPYKTRADQLSVQRILAIVAASSKEKFPATDLNKYGLENPELRLHLIGPKLDDVFSFGTHNPVTEEQYVAYKESVYLLPINYSEAASAQPIEMVDKNLLTPLEAKQIAGFDFSRLEQWIEAQLNLDFNNGQWKTNVAKAKITQNEMNEWLDFSWKQNPAKSVELYTPDHKATYPSLDVKLKDGKKVHLDKISEAPDLVLGRPDEGIMYHFSNDVGFNMLNPPMNIK